MIAVAVVGLLMATAIGGYRLKQRRDHFLSRAQLHEQNADFLMEVYESDRVIRTHWTRDDDLNALRRESDYQAAMARKYSHAARYPWLPIEPDPPPPTP
jgi:hypothetical protein